MFSHQPKVGRQHTYTCTGPAMGRNGADGEDVMLVGKWLMVKIFLDSNLCGAFQT